MAHLFVRPFTPVIEPISFTFCLQILLGRAAEAEALVRWPDTDGPSAASQSGHLCHKSHQ